MKQKNICLFFYGCVVLTVAGCSSGEFRAEELPSKTEIQKEIDSVSASTVIAASAKPMIIAGLKKKMERAK